MIFKFIILLVAFIKLSASTYCPDQITQCNGCQFCPGSQGYCPNCLVSDLTAAGISCSGEGVDPFSTGKEVACCPGLDRYNANYNNAFTGRLTNFICSSQPFTCTPDQLDTYASGSFVPCCSGATSCLKDWVPGVFSFRCVDPNVVKDCRNQPCPVGNGGTCTLQGGDNYCTGKYLPCCEGSTSCLKEWYSNTNNYFYKCAAFDEAKGCLNAVAPIPYTLVGAYKDGAPRAFQKQIAGTSFTPSTCYQQAKAMGYKYFGLQYGGECW